MITLKKVTLLFIMLILSPMVFSQYMNVKSVRKPSNPIALLCNQFDGYVSVEDVVRSGEIEIFPSTNGEVLHFNVKFYGAYKKYTYRCTGPKIRNEILDKLSSVRGFLLIDDITVKIGLDTILLNPIILELAENETNRKITNNFCYSTLKGNSDIIHSSQPEKIKTLFGNLKGDSLKVYTYTFAYWDSEGVHKKNIKSDSDADFVMKVIEGSRHNCGFYIINALYENQGKYIRGTPLEIRCK